MEKISYLFVLVISMFITYSCSKKPDGLREEEIPTENTDEPTNRGCTKYGLLMKLKMELLMALFWGRTIHREPTKLNHLEGAASC